MRENILAAHEMQQMNNRMGKQPHATHSGGAARDDKFLQAVLRDYNNRNTGTGSGSHANTGKVTPGVENTRPRETHGSNSKP